MGPLQGPLLVVETSWAVAPPEKILVSQFVTLESGRREAPPAMAAQVPGSLRGEPAAEPGSDAQ